MLDPVDLLHIQNHVAPPSEDFRNSNILFTGGSGFMGKWFTQSFSQLNKGLSWNAKLTICSRNPDLKTKANDVTVEKIDILEGFSKLEPFSHVIHAASPTDISFFRTNPLETTRSIIEGTKNVLEYSKKCGVKRFLYVSSGAIYGTQAYRVAENSLTEPTNDPYGKGKIEAEKLCLHFASKSFETVISRAFAFSGAYLPLNKHYALGNFIRSASQKETIALTSTGESIRSYLYASDLIIWLWWLLAKGRNGQAYNVGSQNEITILGLAKIVAEITGVDVRFLKSEPSRQVHHYVPDIEKIQNELGMREWVDLKTGIQRMYEWAARNELNSSAL